MSKSNQTEADIIAFIFNNTPIPWASDAAWYFALHSADPTESGNQSTNEISYTGYARVLVSRNAGGFTAAAATATNAAQIQFPLCTGGSATATHWSAGRLSSGAGQIIYKGSLTSSLAISNNVTPQFAASSVSVTED